MAFINPFVPKKASQFESARKSWEKILDEIRPQMFGDATLV